MASSRSAVPETVSTRRAVDYFSCFPLRESGAVQIGRGTADYRSTMSFGRDIILTRLRVEPRMTGFAVPDPDWTVVLLPLLWRGDYHYNGRTVRPGMGFLSGPGGYHTAGEGRDTLAIGIRRWTLANTVAALSGVDPEEVNLRDTALPDASEISDAALKLLRLSEPDRSGSGVPTPSWAGEADLMHILARQLSEALLGGAPRGRRRDPARVVGAIESLLADGGAQGLSIADLCAAAGVGQSSLHSAFVEVYGVSPARYLSLRRLSEVHTWLLDETNPPRSVKDAALSLGFSNGGRFAAEYRAIFDELPSETLLRSRGEAG